MDIKIESGIPIPPAQSCVATGKTKIIREMKIGDSIAIKRDVKDQAGWRSVARSIGVKVSIRNIDENNARMWRVS